MQCTGCSSLYFNPRTSCEVRQLFDADVVMEVYFNPRTSCEVRLEQFQLPVIGIIFQSTHLV